MKSHITFVLDSSGSMSKIADDTKGGFNSFLQEQREEEGEATVTLYNFDTSVTLMYEGISIKEANQLSNENYTPGGNTALYDAIATAIKDTDDYIETLPQTEQPENVIRVILTDGKENASETPGSQVRDLVEAHQDGDRWEFLFIGANQDAALTAEQMGMDKNRSLDMTHSGEGTREAYSSTSEKISEVRRHGTSSGFDEDDRRRQDEAEQE